MGKKQQARVTPGAMCVLMTAVAAGRRFNAAGQVLQLQQAARLGAERRCGGARAVGLEPRQASPAGRAGARGGGCSRWGS
jgi:hypothetical protein